MREYTAQMEAQALAGFFAREFNKVTPEGTPTIRYTVVRTFVGWPRLELAKEGSAEAECAPDVTVRGQDGSNWPGCWVDGWRVDH